MENLRMILGVLVDIVGVLGFSLAFYQMFMKVSFADFHGELKKMEQFLNKSQYSTPKNSEEYLEEFAQEVQVNIGKITHPFKRKKVAKATSLLNEFSSLERKILTPHMTGTYTRLKALAILRDIAKVFNCNINGGASAALLDKYR